MAKTSFLIELKQKRLYAALLGTLVITVFLFVFFTREETPRASPQASAPSFDLPTQDIKPENIRLAHIEKVHDILHERLHSLEKTLLDHKEEKALLETEKNALFQEISSLQAHVQTLETELQNQPAPSSSHLNPLDLPAPLHTLKTWESLEKPTDRHVLFEIPAGSVVKAVLVSGADCSVAVQKPTGPNMILLRPLDNGKLPRNIRVPLKGSVIIGNAIGDIASERVYIRAERMTLVERSGAFVETEISAYVSGEDGREGVRGVVVDRSGQIMTRAAFAAFLQGVSQAVQATLNHQTIQKMADESPRSTLLDLDMYRNSAFQGGATALNKMADYYIKRAEQLQPAIQVGAGRIVDVIFTKTVKIGEKDLKKKFDQEREAQQKLKGKSRTAEDKAYD